jgi:tetratricopeptide (TPR) repeat protein
MAVYRYHYTNDINASIEKGFALFKLGQYEEAIGYYNKALAIDPNKALVLGNKRLAVNNLD